MEPGVKLGEIWKGSNEGTYQITCQLELSVQPSQDAILSLGNECAAGAWFTV